MKTILCVLILLALCVPAHSLMLHTEIVVSFAPQSPTASMHLYTHVGSGDMTDWFFNSATTRTMTFSEHVGDDWGGFVRYLIAGTYNSIHIVGDPNQRYFADPSPLTIDNTNYRTYRLTSNPIPLYLENNSNPIATMFFTGWKTDDPAITPAPVPEPSTIILLLAGLLPIALHYARRNSTTRHQATT